MWNLTSGMHGLLFPPIALKNTQSDLEKVTEGRNDPALTEVLIAESQSTLRWLNSLGLKYRLMYERQAYERADGSYLFWGGLHVGTWAAAKA